MDAQRIRDIVEALEEEINYDPDTVYISKYRIERLITDIKAELNGYR